MTAFALRLPEDKRRRLRALAQTRGTAIDRLLAEMTTLMPAELDARTRFELRAARGVGRSETGLALLDKAAERGAAQPTCVG